MTLLHFLLLLLAMARVGAFLHHCQLVGNSSIGKLHKYVADANFLVQSVKVLTPTTSGGGRHGHSEAGGGECIEALKGVHAHVFFADLDSDGDLDMVGAMGTHERSSEELKQQDFLVYFKNTGSRTAPNLVYQEGFFDNVMTGSSAINNYDGWLPFLADFDHDGDLDLLYTEKKRHHPSTPSNFAGGYIYIHTNEGSPTLPSFVGPANPERRLGSSNAMKFRVRECSQIVGMDVADLDGDGSPDLVLGCDWDGIASVVVVMNPTLPWLIKTKIENQFGDAGAYYNVIISGNTHKVLTFSLTGIGGEAYISPATIDIGKFSFRASS
jgi:hypothetical protein